MAASVAAAISSRSMTVDNGQKRGVITLSSETVPGYLSGFLARHRRGDRPPAVASGCLYISESTGCCIAFLPGSGCPVSDQACGVYVPMRDQAAIRGLEDIVRLCEDGTRRVDGEVGEGEIGGLHGREHLALAVVEVGLPRLPIEFDALGPVDVPQKVLAGEEVLQPLVPLLRIMRAVNLCVRSTCGANAMWPFKKFRNSGRRTGRESFGATGSQLWRRSGHFESAGLGRRAVDRSWGEAWK